MEDDEEVVETLETMLPVVVCLLFARWLRIYRLYDYKWYGKGCFVVVPVYWPMKEIVVLGLLFIVSTLHVTYAKHRTTDAQASLRTRRHFNGNRSCCGTLAFRYEGACEE